MDKYIHSHINSTASQSEKGIFLYKNFQYKIETRNYDYDMQ